MKEFVHIPRESWPKEEEHVEYNTVYRATQNVIELAIEDFLPWNIEHKNQMKTFKNQFNRNQYGMSVFTNLESLISMIQMLPSLKMKTRTISVGHTSLERGISTKEDKKHHVEYYLYDYINNSPKDDFSIFISANEFEQMVNENE